MQTVVSISTSIDHQQWMKSDVTPLLHEHLQDSDIECHYFGCYHVNTDHEEYYDYDPEVLFKRAILFPNATCTFSQLG
jgi:hypothetical protein